MRLKFVMLLFLSFFVRDANAQKAQEYLQACVKDAQAKGAVTVILSANLCSACEDTFEGVFFIKEQSNFKVRYLKYFDGYSEIKILKDTTFFDPFIGNVFKIAANYQDSIFWQLSNIENLLTDTATENGRTLYRSPISHGKLRLLGIFEHDKAVYSLHSIIDLNRTFEKAYYYWLLGSSINNYTSDFLPLRLKLN